MLEVIRGWKTAVGSVDFCGEVLEAEALMHCTERNEAIWKAHAEEC